MSVIFGLENVPPEPRGRALAIGVFDGVHWGHRAIFEQLQTVATERGLVSAALTFEKHPTELLAPTRAPLYINSLDQRVELISALGMDDVIVIEFSPRLAALPKDDFMRNVMHDTLNVRHIVVGSNFRFGHNREGDVRYLAEAGQTLGMASTVVPAVVIAGAPVSSTRIRALIGRGDVEDATRLLGRRFVLRGRVVAGRQVGRTIGFPTANIETAPRQLVPARGVYAVEVALGKSVYLGVCNVGIRPTFGADGQSSIEVHLSGFRGNIYGATLDVVFCRRLRDEMAFDTPEHLAEQIRRDIERANRNC